MSDDRLLDPPSPFVAGWVSEIARRAPTPGRALDIAMGRGRHAEVLAAAGFSTFGVDVSFEAVRHSRDRASERGLTVRGWCADLTSYPLPRARFDVIVVARYLQRDLFPAILDALIDGGVVIYETYTEHQLALGRGPRSPEHLLRDGELRSRFDGFEIVFFEEVRAPEAVARIVARK